jgi:PilZ domain
MTTAEWLHEFRRLHEKARQRGLTPGESADYFAAREAVLSAVTAAQNAELRLELRTRRVMRVGRALQVDVEAPGWSESAVTLDIGAGGFAALLGTPPPPDQPIRASVRLGTERRVIATARVVDVRRRRGSARVSFAFLDLDAAARSELEGYLLDDVLSHLSLFDEVRAQLSALGSVRPLGGFEPG